MKAPEDGISEGLREYPVNNWDVLKVMSARNMDISLAPLSNIEGATHSKKGTLVRIGFAGNVVGGIARGDYVGGLILANAEQYEQVRKELAGRAPAHVCGDPNSACDGECVERSCKARA